MRYRIIIEPIDNPDMRFTLGEGEIHSEVLDKIRMEVRGEDQFDLATTPEFAIEEARRKAQS